MYFINSKSNNLFYFRLLLINVRNITLFENLRTIKVTINNSLNNKIRRIVFAIYQETTLAFGLIDNNSK